jgi:hypothetical protein
LMIVVLFSPCSWIALLSINNVLMSGTAYYLEALNMFMCYQLLFAFMYNVFNSFPLVPRLLVVSAGPIPHQVPMRWYMKSSSFHLNKQSSHALTSSWFCTPFSSSFFSYSLFSYSLFSSYNLFISFLYFLGDNKLLTSI